MIRAITLALVAVMLAACAPGTDFAAPGAVRVDVDTPALRALKAEAGVAPCEQPDTAAHDLGRQGLPAVTLKCLGGGESVNLARLRGPLVLTFWASWCGPCQRELPIFQAFADKYAGSVGVLGIDFRDVRPDNALALIQESGVHFPLLADPEPLVAEAGLRVALLPTLAFIDADGRMTTWSAGAGDGTARFRALEIESLEELEQLATEHLGAGALVPASANVGEVDEP